MQRLAKNAAHFVEVVTRGEDMQGSGFFRERCKKMLRCCMLHLRNVVVEGNVLLRDRPCAQQPAPTMSSLICLC